MIAIILLVLLPTIYGSILMPRYSSDLIQPPKLHGHNISTSTLQFVVSDLEMNIERQENVTNFTMKRMNNKKRRKRSIGSLKINNFLRQEMEEFQSAPPSFVALVFIDLIGALFTINAIAALLFVASR